MKNLLVITLLFSSFAIHSKSLLSEYLDCERKEKNSTKTIHAKVRIDDFSKNGTVMFNLYPLRIDEISDEFISAIRITKQDSRMILLISRKDLSLNESYYDYNEESGNYNKLVDRNYDCKLR